MVRRPLVKESPVPADTYHSKGTQGDAKMKRIREPAYLTENSIFATRLRECLQSRKISQEQLAQAVGVRRQTISLYTTGQSKPDIEVFSKIVLYFGVSAEYLLGLSDDMVRVPSPIDELKLTSRAVENIKHMLEHGESSYYQLKSLNALLGSKRFEDLISDLATYWYGRVVTLHHPDGQREDSPIDDMTVFMEFIRPACLARIQETIVQIKNDIDRRPESSLMTKVSKIEQSSPKEVCSGDAP